MTDRITGAQARELLALPDGAAPWLVEQRNLAETVAWLYGMETGDGRLLTRSWQVDTSPGGRVRMTLRDDEVDDLAAWAHHIEPDEAVDLARALLAAAEEARGHK